MRYLEGEQLDKTKLKNYLGCRCEYLLKRDIDKSGRGFFFPRVGVITSANKLKIDFDDSQDPKSVKTELVEIVLLGERRKP
jgi:hypothetical protein